MGTTRVLLWVNRKVMLSVDVGFCVKGPYGSLSGVLVWGPCPSGLPEIVSVAPLIPLSEEPSLPIRPNKP